MKFITLLSFGKVSFKKHVKNNISAQTTVNVNIAGSTYKVPLDDSDCLENIAPMTGPTMKPTEYATPISACRNVISRKYLEDRRAKKERKLE